MSEKDAEFDRVGKVIKSELPNLSRYVGEVEAERDGAVEQLKGWLAVHKFIAEADQELYWREMDGGTVAPVFNCNDFFAWGCADAEAFTAVDLGEIKKAFEDVEAQDDGKGVGFIWGPLLWIARKRGMRPQGAFYAISQYEGGNSPSGIPRGLTALFNACGPHRPASPGNPYPTPENP